ncbi:NERD domain-containing protein [Sporosarcina sp. Marseille-Q4063]|uniref:nuclease-related domain-containing protein n=1 Tax=Sporosarcina sp. Marseille-Q4063 TaxID=2810514 RepID=UPI001BAEC310|nr:nuclease-related domain-containing protein [Sporosarcina sp. Marseille-Q4063]QUW21195.1 NERD domain-containing protein [Sporosarcina sp. Marseille-Q4063]
MIYKKRGKPNDLLGLTALKNRIHSNHKCVREIADKFNRAKAGYEGEINFDKHLKEFMPKYPHAILHDVYLNQGGVYFQMDSILITPATIIIFEVKNIAGKLIFMGNPDRFVRELDNGERKPMESPIAQLDRKEYFLKEWLSKRGIQAPIQGIVVLAFENEIELLSTPKKHITFAFQVPNYLYSLPLDKGELSGTQIKSLATEMKRRHSDYNPFPIIKNWDVSPVDLKQGVQCQSCKFFGMQWSKQKWNCPKCKSHSVDSHIATTKDWFYLVDSKITNGEFRNFALIENQQVAKRLLKRSGLQLHGKLRTSYYVMKN